MHPITLLAYATVAAALPLLVLLAVRGPVDGEGDMATGWWGEKTANTNWCERDYAVTPYIAEFGNSLSSLAIVGNGIYGIVRHKDSTETRYFWAYFIFIVVGVGSALFHGTLRREFQLLDELPMMWGNAIFVYVIKRMRDPFDAPARTGLAWAIAIATAFASVIVALFDREDQTLFLLFYGGGVCWLLYESRKLNNELNSRGQVLLMETAILFYIGGFFFWLCDRNFCNDFVAGVPVRSMYLHCLWHLGAGTGTFFCVLFWIWTRNTIVKRKQAVRGCSPVDRWIQCARMDVEAGGKGGAATNELTYHVD